MQQFEPKLQPWRSLWRPTSLQNSILSMSASTRQFIFPSKVLVTNGAIGLWKHDGNFVLTDPVVLSTDVEFGTTDGDYGFVVEESQTTHRQPTESSRPTDSPRTAYSPYTAHRQPPDSPQTVFEKANRKCRAGSLK